MAQKIALGMTEGGIVEEVTNANGTAVKFDTGLMICTHELTISRINTSELRSAWTFPQVFNSAPDGWCTITSLSATPAFSQLSTSRIDTFTTTDCNVRLYRLAGTANFTSGDTATFKVFAIGRWK